MPNPKPMSICQPRFSLKTALSMVAVAATLTTLSAPAYACNIPKSYYKHVSCTANSAYFLAVKDSGAPVDLIDSKGKRVVDLSRYSQVDVFQLNEGLLPVQRGGKVGYVTMSGREVVPAIYDVMIGDALTKGWARPANDNRIIVKKQGNFGIIDGNNKVILSFSSDYQTISDYESGSAKVVKNDGSVIWLDENARKIAPPKKQQANSSQPSANTNMGTAVNTAKRNAASNNARPSNKSATSKSTSTGNNSRNTPLNTPLNTPSNAVRAEVWQTAKRDGKWGFVSHNDVPMINFAFDEVTPFSEGLAGVKIDNKWGFVDLSGQLVIPFRFEDVGVNRTKTSTYKGVPAFTFKNGKAWIGNLKDGSKLCINTKGNNIQCDS